MEYSYFDSDAHAASSSSDPKTDFAHAKGFGFLWRKSLREGESGHMMNQKPMPCFAISCWRIACGLRSCLDIDLVPPPPMDQDP